MTHISTSQDPVAPDWSAVNLQDTWPDGLKLSTFAGLSELLRAFRRKERQPVQLPQDLPFDVKVPKYVLQEFHNLPNGNYSRRVSRGYITGFDVTMLGCMRGIRSWMADELNQCRAVLDVGTAGGRAAAAISAAGVEEVWGVDPSPYLLKHAATDYPHIKFMPGIAEELPFPNDRFDGISACFLLHEMPPRYVARALQEFRRVLTPGGKLVIAEPSAEQLSPVKFKHFLTFRGWQHTYFGCLARKAYEPFLAAWHKLDKVETAAEAGLILKKEVPGMPVNRWVFVKPE